MLLHTKSAQQESKNTETKFKRLESEKKQEKKSGKELIKDYQFKGKLSNASDKLSEPDLFKLKKLFACILPEIDGV